MYELTQEQKDVIDKAIEAAKKIIEAFIELWKKVKKALNKALEVFNTYINSLTPRKRYKFLKAVGIKNYLPYFQRTGVFHCRNNC